jgi:uncharacterized glyoxalase superfamily protein PhnB
MELVATRTKSTIMPTMRYKDAPAAIEWLCQILGFTRHEVCPAPDGTIAHAELTLGGGMIMLGSQKNDAYGRGFKSPGELGGIETRSTYVVVKDIDAIYSRALSAKAEIARPFRNTDYGSREFGVKDPEGHTWSVGTYDPWAKHE